MDVYTRRTHMVHTENLITLTHATTWPLPFRVRARTMLWSVLLACALSASVRAAPVSLSGEQDGVYDGADYAVSDEVEVKAGRRMQLLPGATVRFDAGARLVVRGELVCAGDRVLPIVFTSARDGDAAERNAQPFDWNGIVVERGGTIRLAHARISYSSFGIRAGPGCNVVLDSVVFFGNGGANLRVGGVTVAVDENEPFSDPGAPGAAVDAATPQGAAQPAPALSPDVLPPRKRWKAGTGVACALLAGAGIGLAIFEHASARYYHDKYSEGGSDAADYDRLDRQSRVGRNVSLVAAAAGAVGLTVVIVLK
jgi:hypothetical protein